MHRIETEFEISYRCQAVFTEHLFDPENPVLSDCVRADGLENGPARILFVLDTSLATILPELRDSIRAYCAAHSDVLLLAGEVVLTDGGEACKNWETPRLLCNAMLDAKLCRQSYLAIVGGGALLDAAGFAGAVFHRGIRQIRIPTTGLSQCDSGVGVKNGVNLFEKKNLAGVFAPPFAVLNDFAFLRTLPFSAIADAAAEALKVATIRDAAFFGFLEQNASRIVAREDGPVQEMIRRSAELHMCHIADNGDPFEFGSARPLDFGHWLAHKVEILSGHRISHGHAVAMGILVDARYAVLAGILSEHDCARIEALIHAFGLPFDALVTAIRDESGRRAVFDGLTDFREHLGGQLHVTMPVSVGARVELTFVDEARMERAIELVAGDPRFFGVR